MSDHNSIENPEQAGPDLAALELRLPRQRELRLDYAGVREELAAMGIDTPRAVHVAEAISRIRTRKLPNPAVLGNAGSFFKNPVVPVEQADELRLRFPGVVSYPQPGGLTAKLAAGWLIEQAGWKGRDLGPVGMYEKQALVLVNRGGPSHPCTGGEVMTLAKAIQTSVYERFGIRLEPEPVVV